MNCDNCKAGQVYNNVTGNYSICQICRGTGTLTSCDNFDMGNINPIFKRNARCIQCNVRFPHHHYVPANKVDNKITVG